jgi:hypothetical protein
MFGCLPAVETLAWAGLSGVVEEKDCATLISFVTAECECLPGLGGQENENGNHEMPRSNQIYEIIENKTIPSQGPGPYSPVWQVFPSGNIPIFAMYDLYSDAYAREAIEAMMQTKQAVITKSFDEGSPNRWNTLSGTQQNTGNLLFSPVVANEGKSSKVIGSIVLDLDWAYIVGSTVPLWSEGIQFVLESSCGQLSTFVSNGHNADFVGEGDLHDPNYSSMMQQSSFEDYRIIQSATAPYATGGTSNLDCAYQIRVYSSQEFRSSFITHKPRLYALVVIMIFVFTSCVFVTYDCYVSRRQRKVMHAILQRDEIMTSLFPAPIHERLFRPVPANRSLMLQWKAMIRSMKSRANFSNKFTSNIENAASLTPRMEPIAEYFPMVSIVFADISGFTAWSSEREPSQVFELLETVYQVFDKLVNRLGIFKVERQLVTATSRPLESLVTSLTMLCELSGLRTSAFYTFTSLPVN